jgi:hypothetical protein
MKVYEEQLAFPFFSVLIIVFLAITLFFGYLSYNQWQGIDLSYHQEPLWFNLTMGLLFLVFTFTIYQFKKLCILLYHDKLEVSYGLFKRIVLRSEIETIYIDTLNPLLAYGGWGIRFGRYRGKSRIVYNLPGKKNLVAAIKNSNRELVFSVKDSEQFMLALKQ